MHIKQRHLRDGALHGHFKNRDSSGSLIDGVSHFSVRQVMGGCIAGTNNVNSFNLGRKQQQFVKRNLMAEYSITFPASLTVVLKRPTDNIVNPLDAHSMTSHNPTQVER